ncbi:hypothetical protein LEP1GSC172_2755 [Leptospira noguchii]|uniref:Uncharacterized protein n=2 Tax=Leptospira noguchii TaxID=28182 RepID=T0H2A2_9LEPT|nr:hypothetical protein LEP1GSC172_2755 [Leptospira noguchii]EQA73531.1 hypothetical protein LEP1GSC059_0437 [Leptospira noguchii serovar Panama str. CZ214]
MFSIEFIFLLFCVKKWSGSEPAQTYLVPIGFKILETFRNLYETRF